MIVVLFSTCTKNKDDSIKISKKTEIISLEEYIEDKKHINTINNIRKQILEDPDSRLGENLTYAFDLYIRAGRTYKILNKSYYKEIRSELVESERIHWYFFSGGYGILHAFEPAKKYQATFSKRIAKNYSIPFTKNLWQNILPKVSDLVIQKYSPNWVFVFGDPDYTSIFKMTKFWNKSTKKTRIFERNVKEDSSWIQKKLYLVGKAILDDNINDFASKFPPLTKQEYR